MCGDSSSEEYQRPVEDGGSQPTSPLQRYIGLIDKRIAKEIIIENHYSHKWSSCRYAFAIYPNITGIAIFGYPVGRQVCGSISPHVKHDDVLELTRLWCSGVEPKNTESWFVSKCINWIKHNTSIKVLISYADPMQNHVGTIYQAGNWFYQGNHTMMIRGYMHFMCGEWIHPRTCVARYGTIKKSALLDIDPGYERKFQKHKHRYIFIIRNRELIMGTLKHSVLPYPRLKNQTGGL